MLCSCLFTSPFIWRFYSKVKCHFYFVFQPNKTERNEEKKPYSNGANQIYIYERITKPLYVMTLHYINTDKYNCSKSVIETLKLSYVCMFYDR